MSNSLHNKVLKVFKSLHRTRQKVFEGDGRALSAGRIKINEEFKKHKHITNDDSINELINLAENVEKELKQTVVQIKEVKPDIYEAKLTKDTYKFDNFPFKDVEIPKADNTRRKCK